ncbi:E3 ubiquitin/ISG15 ligase TRIM25-like [Hyperolius riggenbachi]|uniref:E3 ubiquitin/ISG15 ligase TRIM25-like n=1 Tax=Hyperolius riggenbachi TaxID=752182 RepID=UPI0035A361E6
MPAYLRNELECSVCKEMLTDPTTLTCGHTFCLKCIEKTWDTQDKGYSLCPNCYQRFKNRPRLQRNWSLRQVVEFCKLTKSKSNTSELSCTYFVHASVAAVKSCLQCEASFCDDHLKVHSKGADHILVDPTTSFKKRKCLTHNKIIDHYCIEDDACICSCCISLEEHRGHHVEIIKVAAEKKKRKLRFMQEDLCCKKRKVEECLENCREVPGKVSDAMELEPQTSHDSFSKTKLFDLSSQIDEIDEICHLTDPFLVLQHGMEKSNESSSEIN